jgi:STE24 endopeptidase
MKIVLLRFADRVRVVSASVCLVLLCPVFFVARADEPAGTPPPIAQLSSQTNNAGHDTSPVVMPEPSAKAMSYDHSRKALLGAITLWNLAIPAVFLFTGFSARIRSWAERTGRKWYYGFALYGVVFFGLFYLVSLPLSYYSGYILPHSYDLSNQAFGKWFGNSLKNMAVLMVAVLAAGWIPFVLMKRSPRRWWFYASLLTLSLLCGLLLIQPVLIAPLFNQYQPLQDKKLEAKILALTARAGIGNGRVYEVNASADTKAVSARVLGFMGTERIVIWDTLLRTFNEDELLFVVGHEMGHYVLGHIVKAVPLAFVLILLSFYAIHLLAGRIIGLFRERFGFGALSDYAALPLVILLLQLFAIAGMPIPMAFLRYEEHEADRFAVELTQDNRAGATSAVKLQQYDLGIPRHGLLRRLWLDTHPSGGERIDFFNSYRPWETGEPSRYDTYIKP